MLKYLIVQLSESSVSFCHYKSTINHKLIPLKTLEKGLLWAVKRDIEIQVLYPPYELPYEYIRLLTNYPHMKIMSEKISNSDIAVLDSWESINNLNRIYDQPAILQTTFCDFIRRYNLLGTALKNFRRLNIMFTDVENFKDNDSEAYRDSLMFLVDVIMSIYKSGQTVQLNLITDRLMLSNMNNCNAGIEFIALSPDGNFYICPSYYIDQFDNIGNLDDGINIVNDQLYELNFAPICKMCDAYHCKRCVWLNKRLTGEVNTPSHQQCVMAHIERSVSIRLLDRIREFGIYAPSVVIPKLEYNDPFEKLNKI